MRKAIGILGIVKVLRFLEGGIVVVQVAQVAVEFHTRAHHNTNDNEESKGPDEPFVAVPGEVVEFLHQREAVRALEDNLVLVQEMRQEHQGEEGVANQGEGGKQAEVPEQVTFRKEQAHEGAYRGNTAHEHGCAFVPEEFFCIAHVVVVDEHMQAVADGYAQHNGAQAQGHQGHDASLDPVHAGQGKEGAVYYGDHLLPHEGEAVEAHDDDNQDKEHGQADGPDQITLDGARIGHTV